jgi:leucyl/phenylalanyl-tRNA---protein transferase
MTRLALLAPDDPPDAFPEPREALSDPPGLLCAGGDLTPARLLAAYRRGIFPWFEDDQPILWWCPDPRAILPTDGLHVSRSLRRTLRSGRFRSSLDEDFTGVVAGCAEAPGRAETWITAAMRSAYGELHALGHAHSVETWFEDRLVGGLYGVAIGSCFFGESMFALEADASKVALAYLAGHLARGGVPFIDCQVPSAHLTSLGAILIPRSEFLVRIAALIDRGVVPPGSWPAKPVPR